jgi:tryptophan synthase beta chain
MVMPEETDKAKQNVPDTHGRFGAFGGQFIPETLMSALAQLEVEYEKAKLTRSSSGNSIGTSILMPVGQANSITHAI